MSFPEDFYSPSHSRCFRTKMRKLSETFWKTSRSCSHRPEKTLNMFWELSGHFLNNLPDVDLLGTLFLLDDIHPLVSLLWFLTTIDTDAARNTVETYNKKTYDKKSRPSISKKMSTKTKENRRKT